MLRRSVALLAPRRALHTGQPPGDTPARGWRKHLSAFRHRPASHVTAFALLHELTAVAPLALVYYALAYLQPTLPLPADLLAEGNRRVSRVRAYLGYPPLDEHSPVLAHLAASYAVVKLAAPLRIALCFLWTPPVARFCIVPVARLFERARKSLR
ncbi:hypothetical protein GGI15_002779 [Coemansia interrupta]|uniref:Uncharacterized protein n=1 Tax=Coemansia interrupta TaxID=1126814 RepID=A0A9W8HJM6_9FUNG|nr:hypothetical protein GGI15_002779 [Coemansia interrupta]